MGAVRLYKGKLTQEDEKMVYSIVRKHLGDNMLYHTDDHNHDNECGCGYLNCSLNMYSSEYGLDEQDCSSIKSFLCEIQKVVVEGAHQEKGVIIFKQDQYLTKDVENEYFVWHKDLDDVITLYLAADIAEHFGFEKEAFAQCALEVRDRNASLTLEKLGADKLPTLVY